MLKIDVVLCSSGGIILVAADGAIAAARMHGGPDLQDGDCTLTSQGAASCMEKARNIISLLLLPGCCMLPIFCKLASFHIY